MSKYQPLRPVLRPSVANCASYPSNHAVDGGTQLQCDLPCKLFCLCPGALALLTGTQAKWATEIGAQRFKHPVARFFPAGFAPSPLANKRGDEWGKSTDIITS